MIVSFKNGERVFTMENADLREAYIISFKYKIYVHILA